MPVAATTVSSRAQRCADLCAPAAVFAGRSSGRRKSHGRSWYSPLLCPAGDHRLGKRRMRHSTETDNPARREQTDAENQPIAPRWPRGVPIVALASRQYFSRIEDVLWIERMFQRAHGVDRLDPEFSLEILLLALPYAVLAGAGPAHRLRALHQAMHEVLAARHLVAIVDVAHQRAVEIAVADMADNRRQQIKTLQVGFGFDHAIGEAGNRHAHIRRHHAR